MSSFVKKSAGNSPNSLFLLLDGTVIACIFSFFDALVAARYTLLNKTVYEYSRKGVCTFSTYGARMVGSLTTSGSFAQYLRPFPRLTSMVFCRCAHFNDLDAERLASLPCMSRVHTLDLRHTAVTNVGMECFARSCTSLRSLRISHLHSVNDRSLVQVVSRNRNLEILDVSVTGVTDEGLVAVAMNCSRLWFLDMSWLEASDVSLSEISDRLSGSIRTIRLPLSVSDQALYNMSASLTCLTSLTLTRLETSDDALVRCAPLLRRLESVHMVHLANVSDRGLEHFFKGLASPTTDASPAELCNNIRLVEIISPGLFVSDLGIGHVVRSSPKLHSLKLRRSVRITDLSLECLAFHRQSQLKQLEFIHMPSLSYKPLSSLVLHAPLLRQLSILNCQSITEQQARALISYVVSNRAMALC